jgi:hypothetical protein
MMRSFCVAAAAAAAATAAPYSYFIQRDAALRRHERVSELADKDDLGTKKEGEKKGRTLRGEMKKEQTSG